MKGEFGQFPNEEREFHDSQQMFAALLAERTTWGALGYREGQEYAAVGPYTLSLLEEAGRMSPDSTSGQRMVVGDNEGEIRRNQITFTDTNRNLYPFQTTSFTIKRTEHTSSIPLLPGLPEDELLRLHLVGNPEQAMILPDSGLGLLTYANLGMHEGKVLRFITDKQPLPLTLFDTLPGAMVDYMDRYRGHQPLLIRVGWEDEQTRLRLSAKEMPLLPPGEETKRTWRRLNTREFGLNDWMPLGLQVQHTPEITQNSRDFTLNGAERQLGGIS